MLSREAFQTQIDEGLKEIQAMYDSEDVAPYVGQENLIKYRPDLAYLLPCLERRRAFLTTMHTYHGVGVPATQFAQLNREADTVYREGYQAALDLLGALYFYSADYGNAYEVFEKIGDGEGMDAVRAHIPPGRKLGKR